MKIYALLIGINDYPNPRIKLNGCLNDVNAVDYFLQQYAAVNGIDYFPKHLLDGTASRDGIIAGFQHFAEAKNEDICLLYYSGHGSQMAAPSEFWRNASDRKCESIVCYDSREPGGRDLADKEISYLLYDHTRDHQAHLITIFDCCHAGSISRNTKMWNRMADPNLTKVKASDFVGVSNYERDGDQLIPPERRHIALSASRAYESAVELNLEGKRRGLFTTSLLEVLNDSKLDQLSYGELMTRIQTKVTNANDKQHPLISAWGGANTKEIFLNGRLKLNPQMVVKQGKGDTWIIDWGGIHGVQVGDRLQVLDKDASAKSLHVLEVFPAFAQLESADWLDPSEGFYPIQEISLSTKKMQVAFHPEMSLEDRDSIRQCKFESFEITTVADQASYYIQSKAQRFSLIAPHEERPVFKALDWNITTKKEVAQGFVNNVQRVARWQSISELSNPLSRLNLDQELEIQMSEAIDHYKYEKLGDGHQVPMPLDGTAIFNYKLSNEEWLPPALMFSAQNKGNKSLWVTALIFTEDYGITDMFLPVKELKPNSDPYEFTDLVDKFRFNIILLNLSDQLHEWGITQIQNRIKIIASTQEFSVADLCQDALEMEPGKGAFRGMGSGAFRSAARKRAPDWATKDIVINIHRPMDGVALNNQQSVKLNALSIEAHPSFSAGLVRLSSSAEANRGVGPPSPNAFFSSEFLEPLNLVTDRNVNSLLDLVELHDVQQAETVHADNPLRLKIDQNLEKDTSFIPFGYDEELMLFLPLGYTNKLGEILIEALPEPVNSGERNLKKSLKIYLQKVRYQRKFKADYPYPILASAKVDRFENLAYVTDPAIIRKEVADADRILILVHGLIGDTSDKAKVMRRAKVTRNGKEEDLSAIYDILLTFDYETLNTPIEESGKALRQRLEDLAGLQPGNGKTVHLLAHSLGGLVCRWFLEKEGGDELVDHFIQVGSPNAGSPWTNAYRLFTFALGRALNFTPIPSVINATLAIIGRRSLSRIEVTTTQITPGSEFYKKLNNQEKGCKIPYTLILGDSLKVPDEDPRAKRMKKKFIKRFFSKVQKGLVKMIFDKDDPNDEIVAISSMKQIPEHKAAHITWYGTVGCHHFNYFTNTPGLNMITKVLFEIEAEEVGERATES